MLNTVIVHDSEQTEPETLLIATLNNMVVISPLYIDQVVPFQRSGVKATQVAASLEMSASLNSAIFCPYYRLVQVQSVRLARFNFIEN